MLSVEVVDLHPTLSGLRVGLIVKHKSGWVRFSDCVVPWRLLVEPEVVRRLVALSAEPPEDRWEEQLELF